MQMRPGVSPARRDLLAREPTDAEQVGAIFQPLERAFNPRLSDIPGLGRTACPERVTEGAQRVEPTLDVSRVCWSR